MGFSPNLNCNPNPNLPTYMQINAYMQYYNNLSL